MNLTKTVKFDNDVLEVIRAMDWSTDGCIGKLVGQLDRKLYERTNKALTVMGGKWNKGKGGHVFVSDPRAQVEGLISSGIVIVERDGFFPTPTTVIDRMFDMLFPFGTVLEPSAGIGAIADALSTIVPKSDITCVEKNANRCAILQAKGYTAKNEDFMFYSPSREFDVAFMNPPFESQQDIDHVLRAESMVTFGLVAVMSEGAFFRTDAKSVEFRKHLLSVNARVEELPENAFKESGTGVRTRLIMIRKG